MVKWRQWSREEAEERWDSKLAGSANCSVFQSLEWGFYKEILGWRSVLYSAEDGAGDTKTLAQVLIKAFPGGVRVGWCRGGPVGDPAILNDDFRRLVRSAAGGWGFYLRISPELELSSERESQMFSLGWKRPLAPLSTGKTLILDLGPTEKALQENFSRNWRHNLSRSQGHGLKISLWESPSARDMKQVYDSMEEYKGISEQHDRLELEALLEGFRERMACLRCDDETGNLLAFRACAMQNKKAWDLLAASKPEGRKCYASYALLWALILHCRKSGIMSYDLGGVDPVGAKGVYDFKKGTGGREIQLMGEWEWASPGWLRRGANFFIARRRIA